MNKFLPKIVKGGFLPADEKVPLLRKMAGLSEKFVEQNNLDIPNNFFWKELLRSAAKL